MVFEREDNSWDYYRRRVTDMKGNTRVIFPKPSKNLDEESRLEVMRMELMEVYRNYVKDHCKDDKGVQESNLSGTQKRGLQKVKRRANDGEIIIVPTDKSGRFAVMTINTKVKAGSKHTDKDYNIDLETVSENQADLNGHISMLIRFARGGIRYRGLVKL